MSFIPFLLYLFCTFIRPQDWVPEFLGLPLIHWLSITTMILILMERMTTKTLALIKVPQNLMMLGFFACILLSQIVHTYMDGLIEAFNEFIIIFLLYFVVLNALDNERKLKISIWFIILMVLALVPQGIFQVQHGYGWAGQNIIYDPDRNESRINWIGIFNDPNDLALLFVVVIGILLAFLFGKTNFFVRILSLGSLAALFYGIYLTNSRGGMLALASTVYFYLIKRTRKFVFGSILGGLCIAGLFAIGPSRVGLISAEEESAYSRIDIWYEGILMMKENPLFGVGFRMFTDRLPLTAHNSFVLVAAELGFIGLFFFIALFYISYKQLSLVQDTDQKLKDFALGLQSSLMGFSAAAFFLSRSYVILPYLLFAMSGALFFIAQKRHLKLSFNLNKNDYRNILLLSVGMLILIYAVIKIGI